MDVLENARQAIGCISFSQDEADKTLSMADICFNNIS